MVPSQEGGSPDQGSLTKTLNGDWYFMSFVWAAYPAGCMPISAPITWGSDGFPVLSTVGGSWTDSYPNLLPTSPTPSWPRADSFSGTSLDVHWEWNHNPGSTKFGVNNGLTLSTATITTDLTHARNTLTHRIHGPQPAGTVCLDFANIADGDRIGLAAFRDNSSYIGVTRSNKTYTSSS